ncbi:acyltransferase [Alloalcanivorax xenomutans]|uniref:acyltransferase n=1 Tax=Alloalcanivorax xenomutans TaxID=1094342 RepID=UPI003A7F8F72
MRGFLRSWGLFLKPLIIFVMGVFFEKEHLKGRFFNERLTGIKWGARCIWQRNILRLAPPTSIPVCLSFTISNCKNITFDADDLNNFQSPGVYLQNSRGHIFLGKGVYIAPNVGIITANHDIQNLDIHEDGKDVVIGDRCWIGMNSVILPGVCLGPGTIVAAGAVVTKSFEEGKCIVAGVPAKIISRN